MHKESKKEGYNIVDKLINDFKIDKTKFNKKGECVIMCKVGDRVVGIGALGIDPLNSQRGRIRRLYVSPQYRNKGVGRTLVEELIHYSSKNFKSVSVNMGKYKVSKFYEGLGFRRYDKEDGITHLLIHNLLN